jgi:hypothetical protein
MRSIAGNGIFGFGYNIGTNLVLSFDDKKLMVLAITGLWRLSELVFGQSGHARRKPKRLLLTSIGSPTMARKRGFA